MNIRKAAITAAGWGTRFLPVTRSHPKEMLPLKANVSLAPKYKFISLEFKNYLNKVLQTGSNTEKER
jgi:UTP-glucose-1-phosphate uridylyltransferase